MLVLNKLLFLQPKQIIMAIHTNTFRTLIREGQELLEEVKLYDRPFSFEEHGRYVLVGVRQAGKSYMLYKRAKQLLANGHQLEELVYIDFDDERLLNMKADDFDKILQSYGSVYSHKPVFFFDEIQNVDGWEHFARRLANQKYMVFITGSNAKMLSRDIQTTLGGRYLDSMVFPYSFSEYLEAQGLQIKREWQYGKTKNLVQQHYSQYLRWGGFPELLLYKNKRHWLNDLYEKILLGDIILRNKVKNEMALRLAIKRLADNILQPTSYNRLANLVKSAGVGTSVASIIDYIKYAKDACLLFTIDNFASKFVDKETIKKHYFTDNGLLSIFLTEDESALLENLCAIHLYRQYRSEMYYYKKNIEVDFYIPKDALAVQSSYSLTDENTRRREVQALKKLNAFQHLNRMVIVTNDEEETIACENGQVIEVIPAWKWLLESGRE